MKVLWISNFPLGKHREMLRVGYNQSGGWLETAYAALKDTADIELGVASIYNGSTMRSEIEGNNTFYLVPSRVPIGQYCEHDEYNLSQWKHVVEDFKPDIIQIWGTEYAMGLCVQLVAPQIPSVVYMQGQMSMIARHCDGGIDFREQLRSASLYEWLRRTTLWHRSKGFKAAEERERLILNNANNVIVESDWCAEICKSIAPKTHIFKSLLPINPLFFNYEWHIEEAEKHSIFTVAGGYPVKGHHMLFKAIAIVKQTFPDVKVYIPGAKLKKPQTFKERITQTSYDRILLDMIEQYNLTDNIIYIGKLNPDEMAAQIAKAHVFVMPSCIENHSSSLLEAMIVGTPSVSSYVGGIDTYYKDRVNGFFYRYEEPERLATIIRNYFEDDSLCQTISDRAMTETRDARFSLDIKRDFKDMYTKFLNASMI